MTRDLVWFWLIRTDLPVVAALAGMLDDEERERARAFQLDRDRRRYVAAHAAARVLLGRHLGVPPREVRWERAGGGKPTVAGVQVNLSHSGRLAALALSRDRPVGVDVQRVRSLDVTRMSARYYPAGEARYVAAGHAPDARRRRFFTLWARKEACLKATGGRLIPGLAVPVHRTGVVRDGTVRYVVRDVPVPDGYFAAVALVGPEAFRIAYGRWPR
jgi:4'-phosphopantetheinyl transferase